MRVVVFEDNDDKWSDINSVLVEKGVRASGIRRVDNVAQFVEICRAQIDLCIIDLLMPGVRGGDCRSAGGELLQMLDFSGMQRIPVLAITAFPGEADQQRQAFAARGCIIYDYNERHVWLQALDIFIAQAKEKGRYEFLIFTSIKAERDAYLALMQSRVESTQRIGLDLLEFDIDGRPGAAILLPRMGLINAAVTVARALESYSPNAVAMSGICAGVAPNATMGQLLAADVVWEYQSGKWLDDAFESEPYQVSIPQATRLTLSKLLEAESLVARLERNYSGDVRPTHISAPKLAPFATGSAVIADGRRLEYVRDQHRKVAGLDMEVFGFHRAVELSGQSIHSFSAKVVVDMADTAKGDSLHKYGCHVSAQFVLDAIRALR
ncbi:response regulator receiver domain protein [Rhodopseudomonas palustris HaA2]|uniref:Response regulator receiver domain protein n=1 Tax=Rhodopseudomonas palustris (strain HaA2) TaxID=316058 RepID=Q2IUU6_RHOP2|nr:transcriptional regulator [Rhodopseudomonas palustris]ABD08014.1 response regulator receiver domain protein [Rhodopseudomonas palustris HaA2]